MSDNEKKLLEEAINGNIESFEKLIISYQKYAYNIALKYMKNPDDAEDNTQEAFIKIFKNLKNFNNESKFSTWLYSIVSNTCKDALRKQEKEKGNVSLNNDNSYKNDIEDSRYEPLQNIEQNELKKNLEEAINTLNKTYREVIVLCDINDLSYSEISEILNIPVGTVRSRINRGRNELRKIINRMENLIAM